MSSDLSAFYSFMNDLAGRGMYAGLDHMQEAVAALGHPEKNFRIVHVAGTNGKGSSCTFLAQILSRSSFRVGLTLSPHVFDFSERIQTAGIAGAALSAIRSDDLVKLHATVSRKLPPDLLLTYFEYSILLALQYFADAKVDIAIIETGLGGRLDATNVCESMLTAITTIGLDHVQILGPTRQDILREKLAIIKSSPHFLFGPSDPDLRAMAREYARGCGSIFHTVDEFFPQPADIKCPLSGYLKNNWLFALSLAKILQLQGLKICEPALACSPDLQVPPARLQVLSRNPLIILDGAHNADGLTALKSYLDATFPEGYDLIFGCLSDRDFLGLAQIIRSSHDNIWAGFPSPDRETPDEVFQRAVLALGGVFQRVNDEFIRDFAYLPHHRPTVVCGSFYLCLAFERAWHALH